MNNNKLDKLKEVTEEIIGEDEFLNFLLSGEPLNHYIGFEISGKVHLGTGIMTGLVVRELQNLGVNTSFWLADWHTWINNKLGGDRQLISKVAKEYFSKALLVSAQIAGADPNKIEVRYGSERYHNNDKVWESLIDISKNLTLSRVIKSTTITGKYDGLSMPFAQAIYPPLQVADIFELGVNIVHAGTDQRKAHVIAREVAHDLSIKPLLDSKGNKLRPIAVHHHLLLGLQKPDIWPLTDDIDKKILMSKFKMSKSKSSSAIFIHDGEDEIRQKMRKAFCPEKEVDYNPVLDWVEHAIFPVVGELKVERASIHGGTFTAKDFSEIRERFQKGELFPLDLKNAAADSLVEILEPAREAFRGIEMQNIISQIENNK